MMHSHSSQKVLGLLSCKLPGKGTSVMISGLMLRCRMTSAPDLPAPDPKISCCLPWSVLFDSQLEALASLMMAHLIAPTPCKLSTTFSRKKSFLASTNHPFLAAKLTQGFVFQGQTQRMCLKVYDD